MSKGESMTPPPSPAPSAPPPCAVPLPPRTVPPPPGPARAGARMLLPCFPADPGRVWLVGAHGGAACTTVYMSDRSLYADAGRALPVSMDPSRPAHVVLCARGTGRGLQALRELLAWWHAGGMGATRLLGVAVTAPCRRTPRALRRGTDLIGSARPPCGACHGYRDSNSMRSPMPGRPPTGACARMCAGRRDVCGPQVRCMRAKMITTYTRAHTRPKPRTAP